MNAWLKKLRKYDPAKPAYAQRVIVISEDVSIGRGEVFLVEDTVLMNRLFNIGWISHAQFGDGVKPETAPAVVPQAKAAGKSRK